MKKLNKSLLLAFFIGCVFVNNAMDDHNNAMSHQEYDEESMAELQVMYDGLQKMHGVLSKMYIILQDLQQRYDAHERADEEVKRMMVQIGSQYVSLKKVYVQRLAAYNERAFEVQVA